MTEHKGLPVHGYGAQTEDAVDQVNVNKLLEEQILRRLDELATTKLVLVDLRWLAIGRTHIEQGFMAVNRALFRPGRVKLPDDRSDEDGA